MILTWVVICHRAGARIVEHRGQSLRLVSEVAHDSGRLKDRQINSDRPGRAHDRAGTGRHAFGVEDSTHEHDASNFAREIADLLYAGRNEKRFARLVLVAEPRFLGLLRQALDHVTASLVSGTLSKDLAHVPLHDLSAHLRDVVLV
jgi:protein required for attachment to host cells